MNTRYLPFDLGDTVADRLTDFKGTVEAVTVRSAYVEVLVTSRTLNGDGVPVGVWFTADRLLATDSARPCGFAVHRGREAD